MHAQAIQRPDKDLFDDMQEYIKEIVDFGGASGHVKFDGNDKPAWLVLLKRS